MVKSLSLVACAALAALAVAFPYHPLQRLGYHRPTARFFGLSVPQIDIPTPHDLVGGALGAAGSVAGGALNVAGGVAGGALDVAGGVTGGALDVAGSVAGGALDLAGGAAGVAGDVATGAAGVAGGVATGAAGVAGDVATGTYDILTAPFRHHGGGSIGGGSIGGGSIGGGSIGGGSIGGGSIGGGSIGGGSIGGGSIGGGISGGIGGGIGGGISGGIGGGIGGGQVPHPAPIPAPIPAPVPAPKAPVPAPSVPVSSHKSWYLILHEWVWTTYVTWSFHGHPLTTGLTWGVECKGVGCQTKTGFVGFKDSSGEAFLSSHGIEAAGSTEHSRDYGKVFCPEGKFMSSMNCKDEACTSMELVCAPLRAGLRAVYDKRWGGVWAADYRRVYCRQGEYIDGIECVGSCTKNFNIFCSKVEAAGSH